MERSLQVGDKEEGVSIQRSAVDGDTVPGGLECSTEIRSRCEDPLLTASRGEREPSHHEANGRESLTVIVGV